MVSKIILLIIGLLQIFAGIWAAGIAFEDTTAYISSIAMMGMFGSFFHSAILIATFWFPDRVRKIISLLLLLWHLPEALLIATQGMGVPEEQQIVGILTHGIICVLALISWYQCREKCYKAKQA